MSWQTSSVQLTVLPLPVGRTLTSVASHCSSAPNTLESSDAYHSKGSRLVYLLSGLITIAFDTLRTFKSCEDILFFMILYTFLELEITTIVSMRPSYRFFVSKQAKSRAYRRAFLSAISLRTLGSRGSDHDLHDRNELANHQASYPPSKNTAGFKPLSSASIPE